MSEVFDVSGQQRLDFFTWGGVIMDYGLVFFGQKWQFKVKTHWRICFLQTSKFSLHKMLIDGLESCGLPVDYCDFLSAIWTLILMAPIHCRGFIGEQVIFLLFYIQEDIYSRLFPLVFFYSLNVNGYHGFSKQHFQWIRTWISIHFLHKAIVHFKRLGI